jgi:hypothetical protein
MKKAARAKKVTWVQHLYRQQSLAGSESGTPSHVEIGGPVMLRDSGQVEQSSNSSVKRSYSGANGSGGRPLAAPLHLAT